MSTSEHKQHPPSEHRNRLARSQSPYLLQHAHNPVDWYPWGEEAFARATREDKPIFLSVGYATCHWCHVMAEESFEDSHMAARINEVFVPVKVDREEHPEVDDQYMLVCQALTGSGGWPLTVLLTPDLKPFFAGTYFPRVSRGGRTGLREIVDRVEHLWRQERQNLLHSAQRLTDVLRQMATADTSGEDLSHETLRAGVEALRHRFDAAHGGFGHAPKFPSPHQLLFLTRQAHQGGVPEPGAMAADTLRAMRAGGVFDQLAGGIHRYSTDAAWRLPHFEKMLYDQALVVLAALEAYQATDREEHREMAERILAFSILELRDPGGGFHTAQDADSEGEEGRYYVWTQEEIVEVLGDQDAALFCRAMGVVPKGNFLDESTGALTGRNVLYQAETPTTLALALNLQEQEASSRLSRASQTLLAHRRLRPRPLQDDKILTDQNGLMLAALARGARVLGDATLLETAEALARFVDAHLTDEAGGLRHCHHARGPRPDAVQPDVARPGGLLDDYAFWIWGLIELYEATLDPAHLSWALHLQAVQDERFWDEAAGGYFLATAGRRDLLVRRIALQDGAVPSGNSAAALNLARLTHLTGRRAMAEQAHRILARFSGQIARHPAAHAHALSALDLLIGPVTEIVVVGPAHDDATEELLDVARRTYLPRSVLLLRDPEEPAHLDALTDFTEHLVPLQGRATAYVCTDRRCEQPLTHPTALRQRLAELQAPQPTSPTRQSP